VLRGVDAGGTHEVGPATASGPWWLGSSVLHLHPRTRPPEAKRIRKTWVRHTVVLTSIRRSSCAVVPLASEARHTGFYDYTPGRV